MNFERLKKLYQKKQYPILPIKVGQQVEIHEKVGDGDNTRIWKFKGLVIKVKKPNHPDGTFTVRGPVARMTIEKIYPLSFLNFDKVLLLDEYKVRRSKLYYIREKVGKSAKMKSLLGQTKDVVDLWAQAAEAAEAKVDSVAVEVAKEDAVVAETKVEEAVETVVEEQVEEKKEAVVEETKAEPAVKEATEEKNEEKSE